MGILICDYFFYQQIKLLQELVFRKDDQFAGA